MDMRPALKALRQGDLVEFTYRQQSGNGQWYRWRTTAVFLGWRTSDYEDIVVVSHRPRAGTSQLDARSIEWVEPVKMSVERLGERGDLDVKLPKRLPGAVGAPAN